MRNGVGVHAGARRAQQYVEQHLAEPLTLGAVAARACLCHQQFSKRFKQATGKTFLRYLTHRRLERAKQLLLEPDSKVVNVALEAGFQSVPTFYRVFQKHSGQTPTAYRAKHCRG